MECFENHRVVLILRKFFSSFYFPVLSAAVVLSCYYLGWDIVSIWYFCLCGVGINLTCKDVTPIFSSFLLMNVVVSMQHSPSTLLAAPSDYYSRPVILTQMIVAIVLLVASMIARIVESIVKRRFKISPIFIGLSVFVLAILLNGIFSTAYTVMDLVFGLFLAVLFLGIFSFANGNIQIGENTFKRIAFYFLVLFAVIAVELLVAYATYDGLIIDGKIIRNKLFFGWGMYNNAGMLFTICIPAFLYLAGTCKHGWAFTLCGTLNLLLACLTMSRQAILMGAIIYVACCVWLLVRVKGKERRINAAILAVLALIAVTLACVFSSKIAALFASLKDNFADGSGRTALWEEAWDKFLHFPVFGQGFFSRTPWVWGKSGFADILPRMYHNTIIQVMESCGLVGLAAYLFHRVQTVVSFFKNVTHERVYLALTVGALLLVSLLDNHLFYMFPTIIYSTLLACFSLSEKKAEQPVASNDDAETERETDRETCLGR